MRRGHIRSRNSVINASRQMQLSNTGFPERPGES